MTKRDERQLEFADIFFSAKRTMDGYNTDEREYFICVLVLESVV